MCIRDRFTTVTDIMPLTDLNRLILKKGLEVINNTKRLGLEKLIEISGLKKGEIDSYAIGYVLGPRINAAGRIGDPNIAVKLLLTESSRFAGKYSKILDSINADRQDLTEHLIEKAKNSENFNPEKKIIILAGEGWDEGIIGLVAGRLQEEYHRPVIIISKGKNDTRGSARSISAFNITDALTEVSHHLEKYGGHAQAAGFTLKESHLEDFIRDIEALGEKEIKDEMLIKQRYIDAEISTDDLSLNIVDELSKLEPHGYGNRKPLFMLKNLLVTDVQELGIKKDADGNPLHIKVTFKGDGIGQSEAILFHCGDDYNNIKQNDLIDIVGYLQLNEWNGNRLAQFIVEEWKESIQ